MPRLCVDAGLPQLDNILDFVEQEARDFGFGPKTINRIRLACEELVVNIISYAYPDSRGSIQVDCSRLGGPPDRERFCLTITDKGIPFNPLEHQGNNSVDLPLEDRDIGGLGIFLIRQVMDELDYKRDKDWNVLTMIKMPE